jgi:hypothetical protein
LGKCIAEKDFIVGLGGALEKDVEFDGSSVIGGLEEISNPSNLVRKSEVRDDKCDVQVRLFVAW